MRVWCGAVGRGGVGREQGHGGSVGSSRVTPSTPQDSSSDPELSDWEKYAAEEYDFLVAEETACDVWDDG